MKTLFEKIRAKQKKFLAQMDLEKFNHVGKTVCLKKGDVIANPEGEIIVAIEGGLSLCMDPDIEHTTHKFMTSESLLFFTVMPFTILGYAESYATHVPLYYYVEQDISILKMTCQEFEDNFLHKDEKTRIDTLSMLSFSTAYMLDIINERTGMQGYEIIRSLIYRYMAISTETNINATSLSSFIVKRSKLSRSYVFKILSELKLGGYINMVNGKLLSINSHLPARF
jgi:hypothetical protein